MPTISSVVQCQRMTTHRKRAQPITTRWKQKHDRDWINLVGEIVHYILNSKIRVYGAGVCNAPHFLKMLRRANADRNLLFPCMLIIMSVVQPVDPKVELVTYAGARENMSCALTEFEADMIHSGRDDRCRRAGKVCSRFPLLSVTYRVRPQKSTGIWSASRPSRESPQARARAFCSAIGRHGVEWCMDHSTVANERRRCAFCAF